MQVSGMALHRLPNALRLAVFAAACGAILYLSLAPSEGLPDVDLWDKAQHALAWSALAVLGLALWPRRPWAAAGAALALGLAVELLQAAMGFGRMGDPADLAADAVGVAAALALAALFRRGRRA